jgi:hypothetical protein
MLLSARVKPHTWRHPQAAWHACDSSGVGANSLEQGKKQGILLYDSIDCEILPKFRKIVRRTGN